MDLVDVESVSEMSQANVEEPQDDGDNQSEENPMRRVVSSPDLGGPWKSSNLRQRSRRNDTCGKCRVVNDLENLAKQFLRKIRRPGCSCRRHRCPRVEIAAPKFHNWPDGS
jgi:hypothetical protein